MARHVLTPGPGRPKGSKTKQQLQIEEKLAALGCDPIEGMALIALDENNPIELRAKMLSELAQYIAPKRKAVEHTGDITTQAFVIMGAAPDATAADWERRNQETMQ
jgi:hypothetical protein